MFVELSVYLVIAIFFLGFRKRKTERQIADYNERRGFIYRVYGPKHLFIDVLIAIFWPVTLPYFFGAWLGQWEITSW